MRSVLVIIFWKRSANYFLAAPMKNYMLLAGVLLTSAIAIAQQTAVDCFGFTVSNLDKSVSFYENVLSFKKVSETELYGEPYEKLTGVFGARFKRVRLKLGNEEIELTDYLTSGGRPIPMDSKSNDLWFQHIAIVVSDMDAAYDVLRKNNVEHVSTAPQTLPAFITAAAGIKAFYFHDPDGHNLELIYFPKGKGDPKWQQHASGIFLGIDHSAIGVSSSRASKDFYELLGVTAKGDSFNYGNEQAHLNNVEGASLHITGNRAVSGPGIEFLEYLNPVDGRKYPVDEKADDIVHWETLLFTPDLDATYRTLRVHHVLFVSKDIIEISSMPGNATKRGFYVRDPDGHVVGIFER
jgi:catechol 2,3-dioxygenase-like lactoylglutathione lyase family enzyme